LYNKQCIKAFKRRISVEIELSLRIFFQLAVHVKMTHLPCVSLVVSIESGVARLD